jgi:hypothetical protein
LIATGLFFIVFTLVATSIVAAQYYGGPGGQLSGFVYGPNGAGADWVQILANNGSQTFHGFSGMSGFYLMRLPAGVYNVSVYDPGLLRWANSVNVTITDGSSITLDFHLQWPPAVAVPEFQTNMAGLIMALALAASIALAKRKSTRELARL